MLVRESKISKGDNPIGEDKAMLQQEGYAVLQATNNYLA
jgi:hypothetical protein